jgi:hypothetical protein
MFPRMTQVKSVDKKVFGKKIAALSQKMETMHGNLKPVPAI